MQMRSMYCLFMSVVMLFMVAMNAQAFQEVSSPGLPFGWEPHEDCEHLGKRQRLRCLHEQDRLLAEYIDASRRVEDEYLLPLTEALAKTGRPRDLALAAALRRMILAAPRRATDPRVNAWRLDALNRGEDDPLVALLVRYRSDQDDADEIDDQAIQRWIRSDPGNLAPLLLSSKDDPAWWMSVRNADRNIGYFADVRQLLRDTIAANPPPGARADDIRLSWHGDAETFVEAMGLQLVMAGVPAYANLMSACRAPARSSSPDRAVDCRRLGVLMAERSDLVISEMIGLALLRYDDDSVIREDAEQRTRSTKWLLQRWAALADGDDTVTQNFARTHAGLGEAQLMRAFVVEHGGSLVPPPDWSPGGSRSP